MNNMKKDHDGERILEEINQTLGKTGEKPREELISEIEQAKRVFIAGAGRSGLVGRMFAMRLSHLGKEVHIAGSTLCPPIGPGDLLIAISSSGKTGTTLLHGRTAKKASARIAAITGSKTSPLARLADRTMVIPAGPTIQPGNSLFEQASLILLDTVILRYQQSQRIPPSRLKKRHANLE